MRILSGHWKRPYYHNRIHVFYWRHLRSIRTSRTDGWRHWIVVFFVFCPTCSLRTANTFPVVASRERSDDRKCVCCSQAIQHGAWFWKYLRDLFELIKWSPRRNFSRSCLHVRKTEKSRQKQFLGTLKCQNWEKCSQQSAENSCHLSRRYEENEKCLRAYSPWGVRALQNVWEKLSSSKIKEKGRSRGEKQRLWLGKTSTNPRTVKRYEVSLSICLWYKRIDSMLLCVC